MKEHHITWAVIWLSTICIIFAPIPMAIIFTVIGIAAGIRGPLSEVENLYDTTGKVWVHKKSGKQYHRVNFDTLEQVEGAWVPGKVTYYSVDPSVTHQFQRPREEFLEKFVQVVPTYTGVRGHEPFSTAPSPRSRGERCPLKVPPVVLNTPYEG